MPQCKIDGCREQAQKYGKRLCPEHEARRAAKAKAYRSLPLCTFCATQYTNNQTKFGEPECPTCRNKRWEREEAQEKTNAIIDKLEECSTIDELKEFIRYEILEKIK